MKKSLSRPSRSSAKKLMRLKGATFLLFFLITQSATFAAFSDVPDTHPFSSDIKNLEQRGIVQEETFQPDEKITREVFAKWLLKNVGFVSEHYKPAAKKRFLDVHLKNNQFAPYIYRLNDLGALDATHKEKIYFGPKDPITRKEALLWLFFAEGIPVPKVFDEKNYKAADVPAVSPLAPLVHKAVSIGLLKSGRTKPFKKLTRAEAAHFLSAVKKLPTTLTVTILPTVESDLARNPKYDLLLSTWNRVGDTFLHRDQLNRSNLMYGAIEGVVKELKDKYSDFERPGDNVLLEELSGEIEGIGAVIQMKDEQVVVVSPIMGTPAQRAGLRPHDIIIKVDDIDIKGMKLTEVVKRIKGKRGTEVKITIRRAAETLDFKITRDVIKIVSAQLKERTFDNIAIIALANFGENTVSEFRKISEELLANKPKAIILDMRNNPGGYLNAAISLSGYFIAAGERVSSVRYPDRTDTYNSPGKKEFAGIKIIAIVNKGTASAAEILAGALQDYKIAHIVGEKTYGKGTVQELTTFTDGSTLKLTVAEWLTPNGKLIEGAGIMPDTVVELTEEDRKQDKDPQMEKALEEARK